MRSTGLTLLLAALVGQAAAAQELSSAHQVMLAEAFRLMDHVEPRWEDWASAPEAILLVDEDVEYLVGHPGPSDDFLPVPGVSVEGRRVYSRDRVSQEGLLATYPAVEGLPTIVVGTPEATGLTPTRWILTVLHEHFHQLQMSRPDYYGGVDALDLSGGDESGMWMLDYPFPYDVPAIDRVVSRWGHAAADLAERLPRGGDRAAALQAYLTARSTVAEALDPNDYRYLAFQVWQEGVARYAEFDAAEYAADTFRVSEQFEALTGFVPFEAAAAALWEAIVDGVAQELSVSERVYFYSLGALEAWLLEEARPGWRSRYTLEPFDTGPYWRE